MAYKSTQKSIRIQDLADKLGTSASTVSRALNDHPKISKATKQKVLNMALKMGYKPNIPSLISDTESKAVALIIPNATDKYYADIVNAFKRFFEKEGCVVFVAETNYDIKKEALYFKQLELMNIRGVAYLFHKESKSLSILNDFIEKDFPMVFIHENHLKDKVSSVILDVYQSLSDTISHFKSYEAKRVALLVEDTKNPINSQVEEMFDEILELEEFPANGKHIFHIDADNDKVQAEIKRLLSENQFDSVLCSSMKLAYLLQKLTADSQEKMLIASLSYDVFDIVASPKISHFKLQAHEIGTKAAALLIDKLKGNHKAKSVAFFSRLVIKSSSIRV